MAGIPWTAVASTGAVDEESIYARRYAVGDLPSLTSPEDSSLRFREGNQDFGLNGLIVARYNVTDTSPSSVTPITVPGWTSLELGAIAPPGSDVYAVLYRVTPCTGKVKIIAGVRIVPGSQPCEVSDPFPANEVDFGESLYYVRVRIHRDNPTSEPQAFTLRLL